MVMLQCFLSCDAVAQNGNMTAQEYGDAVYVYLDVLWGILNYNHTAIYAGLDSSDNGRVLQAYGKGVTVGDYSFSDYFTSQGSGYYGAYTLANTTLTFSQRASIVSTAVNLANAQIPYPPYPIPTLAPVCIDYAGTPPVPISNIQAIRCDGVVEYSYNYNGLRVWRNKNYADSQWSIVNYPDSFNDWPANLREPDVEASPWAQRGAPCATGPYGTSLGCSYNSPDTQMTQPAVISLPTYQVTLVTNAGYADVTVQATDESGIHFIRCIKPGETDWTLGPTQPQHPISDTCSWTVRITNSGTFYYAAVDNGDNAPTWAQTPHVTITVPTKNVEINPPPVQFAPATFVGVATDCMAVGDFNGDGKQDIVFANGAYPGGVVTVLSGKGNGTFDLPRQTAWTTSLGGSAPRSIAVGDFNHDGKLDVLIADYLSGNVWVLLGVGDGTFRNPHEFFAGGVGLNVVAVGDFNKDGKLDFVASSGELPNPIILSLGNGDGTFGSATPIDSGSASSLVVADIDGDGNLDLVLAGRSAIGGSPVSVLFGRGNGTFDSARDYGSDGASSVAVGDVNRDGKLDIITTYSVFLGLGNRTFAAPVSLPYIGDWDISLAVAIADFNGDGNLDVVKANSEESTVGILLGRGDGTFLNPTNFIVGLGPAPIAIADLDADGRPDIVTTVGVSPIAAVLLNRTPFPDSVKPTVSISSPPDGTRLTNAVVTIQGTASDNVGVAIVEWRLENGNGIGTYHAASGTITWSATVAGLTPGTNTVRIRCRDLSGNLSTEVTCSLIYVVVGPLTLTISGQGTVSPNYNGQLLEIGRAYSVTASAAAGFAFANWVVSTNWTGGVTYTSATLSFLMQPNLTLQVSFMDTNKPALALTTPTTGQRWSNAVFTMRGTASDNVQVTNVAYQLNGAGWNPAVTGNGWSNWTAVVSLTPGTNIVRAYAVDATGNRSLTNSVSFLYVVSDTLCVQITGRGTLTPNYSNAVLEIGNVYTMKATAGAGYAFTNWVVSTNWIGGAMTNNATVRFIMESNLTLQANFADVTKPTITITSPTAGQKMTTPLANVKGTAGDNWGVRSVQYQLNNGGWSLAASTNGWTNWTVLLPLKAGTNVIKAYAVDLGGNTSTTNSVGVVSSNAFNMRLGFTSPQPMTSDGPQLSLEISLGISGRIEASTNLEDWTTLSSVVSTNATMQFRYSMVTNGNWRFYRVVVP